MRHAYPLMLDVTDRLIVIVGGGAVAVRKADGLLAAGAQRIRCVSLAFDPRMPAAVDRLLAPFQPSHVRGASLVFAATDDPAVNDAVIQAAHAAGALVCRADADEESPGDFSTPALWRDAAVVVTVSAGGSPALAARIRDDLAAKVDPRDVRLAAAMREIRPAIRDASDLPIERRRELFRALSSRDAASALVDGGLSGLMDWLTRTFPDARGKIVLSTTPTEVPAGSSPRAVS